MIGYFVRTKSFQQKTHESKTYYRNCDCEPVKSDQLDALVMSLPSLPPFREEDLEAWQAYQNQLGQIEKLFDHRHCAITRDWLEVFVRQHPMDLPRSSAALRAEDIYQKMCKAAEEAAKPKTLLQRLKSIFN